MKKVLVFLLCAAFLMSSFASFAEAEQPVTSEETKVAVEDQAVSSTGDENAQPEETGNAGQEAATEETQITGQTESTLSVEEVTDSTPTEEIVEAVTNEEPVSEEEVAELVGKDEFKAIEAEQQSVASSIYNVNEITPENVVVVLGAIKKYLTVRDRYYRTVLIKLKAISMTKNKALARRAIIKFEQMFNRQKEIDRRIHSKIEKVLKYINKNKNKLNNKQKIALRTQLKPVIQKYYKHRQLIIHIHRTIQKLKLAAYKDHVVQMKQFAAQLEKAKKFNAALRLYEEALKNGEADKETFKKISEMNQKLGKKGPGIYVGKKRVQANIDPVVKNGTTLVPLRAVSESLEAEVKWDGKTSTVTIIKGGKVIKLPLRSKVIYINGEKKTITQPAEIISGNTVVPLRVVSETLDAKVGYDKETKIVTVEDNFTAPEGTISAEAAAETGVVAGSDIPKDVTGEQVAEELLNQAQ